MTKPTRVCQCVHVREKTRAAALVMAMHSTQHWRGDELRDFEELCVECAARVFAVLGRVEVGASDP